MIAFVFFVDDLLVSGPQFSVALGFVVWRRREEDWIWRDGLSSCHFFFILDIEYVLLAELLFDFADEFGP